MLALLCQFAMATPARTIESVQEEAQPKISVNQQIDNILKQSANYQDVKLVKKSWLENLKNDFSVFLSDSEKELASAKASLSRTQTEMNLLQSEHNKIKEAYNRAQANGGEISILGIPMAKNLYHVLVLSVLFALVVLAGWFGYRYKKANEITQNSKGLLTDLEDEFETFKRSAIEREQKLRRQLQDEINKQKAAVETKIELN